MMFEVLETSWGMLQESLDAAGTLDDIIQAHKAYIEGILARALLNDENISVKNKLQEVSKMCWQRSSNTNLACGE